MRYLLKIAYDGTAYHGWQVQSNAVTVQETVQDGLEKLLSKRIGVTGCSRTDAGVHAKEYYFHIDCDEIPEKALVFGLNSYLPDDIRVFSAKPVESDFHARYSVKSKTYTYLFDTAAVEDPFLRNYAWHFDRALDLDKMNAFCASLVGTHDFAGFSSSGRSVEDTVRKVYECRAEREENLLRLTVSADGFLYNMVRIIAGTAADIGCGTITETDYSALIGSLDRNRAGQTAPAHGLYLTKVVY